MKSFRDLGTPEIKDFVKIQEIIGAQFIIPNVRRNKGTQIDFQ